jgi:preprotein translocase SecE subunit
MSIFQYLRDTQGELRHVAWPTRLQTIVYTALVIALSIVVALYLGLFDYIFTTALSRYIGAESTGPTPALEISASSSPSTPAPTFDIPTE